MGNAEGILKSPAAAAVVGTAVTVAAGGGAVATATVAVTAASLAAAYAVYSESPFSAGSNGPANIEALEIMYALSMARKSKEKIEKELEDAEDGKEKPQESPEMLKHNQDQEKQATAEDSASRPGTKFVHSTNDIHIFTGNAVSNVGVESFKKDNQEKDRVAKSFEHPQRPGKPNCYFYVGTGRCKFESNCWFNHPPKRKKNEDGKEKIQESPEMLKHNQDKEMEATGEKSPCRPSTNDSAGYSGDAAPTAVNNEGIESLKKDNQKKEREGNSCEHPLRPDESNCKFFMETGTCKFGSNCKFNHPPIRKKNEVKRLKTKKLSEIKQAKQATMKDSPCRPCPKVMHSANSIPGFAGNTARYVVNNDGIESFKKDNQEKEKVGKSCEPPQRPVEPNCNFYMATGTCKFGSNCKFNHPPKRKEVKTKKVSEVLQVVKKEHESAQQSTPPTTYEVEGSKFNSSYDMFELVLHDGMDVYKDTTVISSMKREEDNGDQMIAGGSEYLETVAEPNCSLSIKNNTCEPGLSSHVNRQPPIRKRNKAKANKQVEVEQIEKDKGKGKGKAAAFEGYGKGGCKCTLHISHGRMIGESCEFHLDKLKDTTLQLNFLDIPLRPDGKEKPQESLQIEKELEDVEMDKEKGKAAASERDGKGGCKCTLHISDGQVIGESCEFHLVKLQDTTVQLNFLDLPLRPGRKECPHYMRTGSCKHALNCQYHHPDPTASSGQDPLSQCQRGQPTQGYISGLSSVHVAPWPMQTAPAEQTFFGDAWARTHLPFEWLPMNHEFSDYQGRKEYSRYMRTGNCEHDLNCQYHYPDPAASGGQYPFSQCQNGQSAQGYISGLSSVPVTPWPMQTAPTEPTFFGDAWAGTHLPFEWLPTNNEFSDYQGLDCPVYPMFQPETNVQTPTVNTNSSENNPRVKKNHLSKYPQRPGQPECQSFKENGTCKYKSACKFDHPRNLVSAQRSPLKTEQRPCINFKNHGSCKHGSTCRFQHSVCGSSPSRVSVASQNCEKPQTKKR